MVLRFLIISVSVFWFFVAGNAQQTVIYGKVISGKQPLEHVSIFLNGQNKGTVTDSSGYYVLQNVKKGTYELVASSVGYISDKKIITVEQDSLRVDFYLKELVSSLEEVTIMVERSKGLQDIPGAINYVSPEEIQKFGYNDVGRTLRTVPGINIQEEDGAGLFPNIGMRGTGVERSSKITLMEDGVLIAPAPYSAPAAYYFPSMGRINSIEILKGSSQIKYGPYTTGGALNLISTPIPSSLSAKFNVLTGSFNNKQVYAMAGGSGKHIDYMIESFQQKSDGFKTIDGSSSRGLPQNTGFEKQDYLAKVRFHTDEKARIYHSLLFKLGYATGDINVVMQQVI